MMNLALLQNFDPGRTFFKVGARLGGFFMVFPDFPGKKHEETQSFCWTSHLNGVWMMVLYLGKWNFGGFEGWYIMDVDVLHGQNPQFGMVSSFVSLREPQIFVFSTKDMPLLGTQFGSESISDVTRYQIPGWNASISGLGSAACYRHPGVT